MLDVKKFLEAIDLLEQQGIAKEVTVKALAETFETIVKKKHVEGLPDLIVKVDIIPEKGEINVYNLKDIVEEVQDDAIEISLEDALEIDPNAQLGGQVQIKVEIDDFKGADVKKFMSVFKQKIKEAEKAAILALYSDKIDEMITGYVEKVEPKYTLVNIGRTSVTLSDKEKIGDEVFSVGQAIKVYLAAVGNSGDSGITISRAHPGFLKRLFEEEIRDVYDGTVIIKDIAREAGERSKVSVTTNDINVDPVGACIGPGGSKIQKICAQINHEKIDIIQYHQHKGLFIAECLKPANVIGIKENEDGSVIAIVKDGELRVAIGKRGVNARLAVKLAGCKIDIKEESVAKEEGVTYTTLDEMKKQEEEMIIEARRKALLEQIAREEELRKQREAEEALNPKPAVTEVEDDFDEFDDDDEYEYIEVDDDEDIQDEDVETYEEVKPEEVEEEETEEEDMVEYNPVIMQPKVSLADLEKQIEEEKKKKANQNTYVNKKKNKVEEEDVQEKVTKETNRMDIYTQDELDELDAEEYDDDQYDDEEIDYDQYDEYYEDK